MDTVRRIPTRVIFFIAEQFLKAFESFKAQREIVVAYSLTEFISAGVLETMCHANGMNQQVSTRPHGANPGRVKYLTVALERATAELQKLEIRFLTSLCLAERVENRVDNLDVGVYADRYREIDMLHEAWYDLREIRPVDLGTIRAAYDALNKALTDAGAIVPRVPTAAERVRLTLSSSNPAATPARVKKFTPGTTTGMSGQKPSKDGGWGTSKKVAQKKRKRARQQA